MCHHVANKNIGQVMKSGIIMATETNRDITAELRGALIEVKESMDGKRKLNTLDRLIVELKEDVKL